MNLTLYRKYRPKTFGEVEGQEHVVQTLKGALLSGRIGHAYLFAGPRGTGKTTMARLFAKALNCLNLEPKTYNLKPDAVEPCNICDSCTAINNSQSLDLIEIDAASNRGIDEIRALKESALVVAPGGGHKIFIVDEAHMLTPPAFNALLKILEEPPPRVIFIMATTEIHKMPETILSRVQRFDFRKISHEQIVGKLKRIAREEKLKIDDESLAIVAAHAEGSLRDSESVLAKLAAFTGDGNITGARTAEILGIVPRQTHENLLGLIYAKNTQGAVSLIGQLYESGVDLENFAKHFIHYLRSNLISSLENPNAGSSAQIPPRDLVRIMNAFLRTRYEIKNSPIPQLPLELAVMELIDG